MSVSNGGINKKIGQRVTVGKEQVGIQRMTLKRGATPEKIKGKSILALTGGGKWLKHRHTQLKGLRFDSQSRLHSWIAGLIASPGQGVCARQICLFSHLDVSLSSLRFHPLPPPFHFLK